MFTHKCMFTYTLIHTYMFIYMHTHAYSHTCIHTHSCMFTYIHTHKHMCVFVCANAQLLNTTILSLLQRPGVLAGLRLEYDPSQIP